MIIAFTEKNGRWTIPMRPGSSKVYGIDFSNYLLKEGAGVSVSSAEVTGSGVTISEKIVTGGNRVSFRASGAVENTDPYAEVTYTLSNGDVGKERLYFEITWRA